MPELFDMQLRGQRRDRADRMGVELFLHQRAFDDCLERIGIIGRRFDRALLLGCPSPEWPERLRSYCDQVDVGDPGHRFAARAGGEVVIEDAWLPPTAAYDLVLAIGTLDTVNDLALALRLIHHSLRPGGLLIGALPGGETLPQLRNAMRAADALSTTAAPHVHPRIEPSALAPLLAETGFANPVVDIDRVEVSYETLDRLVADLRAMGATNVLRSRPRFIGKDGLAAARRAFSQAGDGERTSETVEILHFAARTAADTSSDR
jgi:NADH dehydrogenase [ubiquinone] 1 alpha subcomplex assembly factor 5